MRTSGNARDEDKETIIVYYGQKNEMFKEEWEIPDFSLVDLRAYGAWPGVNLKLDKGGKMLWPPDSLGPPKMNTY